MEQKVAMNLNLHTTVLQGDQTAQQEDASIERRQNRLVEVLDVDQGRVRKAQVTFQSAGGGRSAAGERSTRGR